MWTAVDDDDEGQFMNVMTRGAILLAGMFTLTPPLAARQEPPQLRFDVESIRPSTSQGPSFLSVTGDRFTATNFPLRVLIRNAYRLQPSQLLGAPAWLDDRYDIVAKSPVRVTGDAQREMLRA